MKPTRGCTSQRTSTYHLVLNADFVTRAWTSQVSFRELQRCYPEARRWLSWDQTDLRAIMKPRPFFDILTVALTAWAPASRSRPAAGGWSDAVSPTCRSPAPSHPTRTCGCAQAQLTSSDGPKEASSKITPRKNQLLFPLSNICYQANSSVLTMHPHTALM